MSVTSSDVRDFVDEAGDNPPLQQQALDHMVKILNAQRASGTAVLTRRGGLDDLPANESCAKTIVDIVTRSPSVPVR